MKAHFPLLICLHLLLWLPFVVQESQSKGREYLLPILEELDDAVEHKKQYHTQKKEKIQALKHQLMYMSGEIEQYECYGKLFEEYLHYQADSAVYYLNRQSELLPLEEYENGEEEVLIDQAAVMGVMGMYADALHVLEKIQPDKLNPEIRAKYYRACRSCYGWLADYTIEQRVKQKYLEKTDQYRDSILLVDIPITADIARAERAALNGRAEEAVAILEKYLPAGTDDMETLSYLNYTMYEAYLAKGDVEKQIEYLARTALWDMKRVVREYASLHKLARLLYEQGDIDRAYNYLNCSMEDAVDCHARLRSLEVTEVYPIIDRAYKEKEAHERAVVTGLLIGISVVSLLLIAAVFYLYSWMKKLTAMRHNLSEANLQLQAVNQNLEQTGKIKEVYIARYLDRCVGYLDKLEQYRRSLEKLAMASQIEALFAAIRSDQFLRDERKAFYRDFDHSFLDLFPHFIEDFNNLLVEDGRIVVKPGELLNTELRIFALIRLGVTDTNSIAHFLGYSITTVYNYRSKYRNKALGNRDKFEQKVMKI